MPGGSPWGLAGLLDSMSPLLITGQKKKKKRGSVLKTHLKMLLHVLLFSDLIQGSHKNPGAVDTREAFFNIHIKGNKIDIIVCLQLRSLDFGFL